MHSHQCQLLHVRIRVWYSALGSNRTIGGDDAQHYRHGVQRLLSVHVSWYSPPGTMTKWYAGSVGVMGTSLLAAFYCLPTDPKPSRLRTPSSLALWLALSPLSGFGHVIREKSTAGMRFLFVWHHHECRVLGIALSSVQGPVLHST